MTPAGLPRPGETCERLELERVWLVDPWTGREGAATLVVEGGHISELRWARASGSRGQPPGLLVLPGLTDLHAHFREPGDEDAETIASGLAAAGHGGFTRVCLMPNTEPPIDGPGVLRQVIAAAQASGSPIRVLAYGTTTAGRAGKTLSAMGELAAAGAIGFSDDGAPVADAALFANALAYAGALGRVVVEHAQDPTLTAGAEMHEGLTATILGLHGWPTSGELTAVARAIAVLDEVGRGAPAGAAPRLHLTHLSTAGSVELVRRAKAAGLAVTCDVSPHHLALHDGWVAGDRRYAWAAAGAPWTGGESEVPAYDTATRVNPPLRTPADAAALATGLGDGTVDAIATDHAPHTEVAKAVEYGDAANGISGIETALGLLLAAVQAGQLDLVTLARALVTGPARVLGLDAPAGESAGLSVGAPADLVVVDRGETWRVGPATLRSKGLNSPLVGRDLPGRVLVTISAGRFAFVDPALGDGQADGAR
ncbi:MAG: dihydroorotase [Candidatus Limnocylindrales bacterium]